MPTPRGSAAVNALAVARVLVCAIGAALLVGVPGVRAIEPFTLPRMGFTWVWGWTMFSTALSNQCHLRVTDAQGRHVDWRDPRFNVREEFRKNLRQRADVAQVVDTLCAASNSLFYDLPGAERVSSPELHVHARCGRNGFWDTISDVHQSACQQNWHSYSVGTNVKLWEVVGVWPVAGIVVAYLATFAWSSWRDIARPTPRSCVSLSLARILVVFLLWARFGDELQQRRVTQIGALFFAASAAMAVGFCSRSSCALVGALCLYMRFTIGNHHHEPWGHHHVSALCFLPCLLAATPCGGALSVDAYLSASASQTATQWALPLVRLHFSAIYFWSLLDKLDTRWLSGDRMEQIALGGHLRSEWLDGLTGTAGAGQLWRLVTYATIALEGVATLSFFSERLARAALVPMLVLHAVMYVVVSVYTFSCTMFVGCLLAADPEAVAQCLLRSMGVPPAKPPVGGHGHGSKEKKDNKSPANPASPKKGSSLSGVGAAHVLAAVCVAAVSSLVASWRSGQLAPIPLTAVPHGAVQPTKVWPAPGSGNGSDGMVVVQWRGDAARTGYTPVSTPDAVRQLWRHNGLNKGTHTAVKGSPVLLPDGEGFLVPGDAGVLMRYTFGGRVVWTAAQRELSPFGFHGSPCATDGLAVIGAYNGVLYAYDLETGELKWEHTCGEHIGASPACTADTIFISVEFSRKVGGGTCAVSTKGKRLWCAHDHGSHSHSSPAFDVVRGFAASGSNDRHIHIYNASTGVKLHKYATGGAIKGPVLMWKGLVLFASWDSYLYAVDLVTGSLRWRANIGARGSMGGPAVDPTTNYVYVGSDDMAVRAFRWYDGQLVWIFRESKATGGERDLNKVRGSITVTHNAVVFGCMGGVVWALDKLTGEKVWSYIDGRTGAISSTMAVSDDYVIYTTNAYGYTTNNQCQGKPGAVHVLHRVGAPLPMLHGGAVSVAGL